MFTPIDSEGRPINPDSWPHTYDWNADGTLNYEEVSNGVGTWRKTYAYNNGQLFTTTAWVKQ